MTHDYRQKLLQEIKIQTDPQSGHPDEGIRKFYQAVLNCYQPETQLALVIDNAIATRSNITPVHLATLLPRAAQYTLRKHNITDYLNYNVNSWISAIENLISVAPEFNYAINNLNNSATRPQSRYRSLAALVSSLNKSPQSLILQDWGCSLNMGLAGLLTRKFYQNELSKPIIDHTHNEILKKLIKQDHLNIVQGIGIDILPPDVDWIHACEYFSNYDARTSFFAEINSPDSNNTIPLQFISADISSSVFPSLAPINQLKDTPYRQIIFMSMVLYQLSPQARKQTFSNALEILNDQDLLVTLDYVNNAIRFSDQNITVKIYIKNNQKFSKGYEWLRWTDATCQEVFPGVDFELTNQILNIQ